MPIFKICGEGEIPARSDSKVTFSSSLASDSLSWAALNARTLSFIDSRLFAFAHISLLPVMFLLKHNPSNLFYI